MERLRSRRADGLNSAVIRAFGLVFLLVGAIGRAISQSDFLGIAALEMEKWSAHIQANPDLLGLMITAWILQAVETCAVPIFAFLLAEGLERTADVKKYAIRVAAVALACEIPFDLLMSGKIFWLDYQNPVFGLLIAMALVYFFLRFEESSGKNLFMKILLLAVAVLWANMLRLDAAGAGLIILTAALWEFRESRRWLAGILACVLCALLSPFFLAAPLSFLILQAFNSEKGGDNRWVNYLAYPVILLAVALGTRFLF